MKGKDGEGPGYGQCGAAAQWPVCSPLPAPPPALPVAVAAPPPPSPSSAACPEANPPALGCLLTPVR